MIVTLRAADRQTEHRRAEMARQIVEGHLASEMNVGGVALIGPHPAVTGRGECFGIVGEQLVSRQLLLEEAVERQIAIERTDDIVAVLVREWPSRVGIETCGLGESHDIEPQAAPSLTVVRAGQQPFDQLLVSLG